MTERIPEGSGSSPPFKKIQDHVQFERAPAPREPTKESGDPNLNFEAAPRTPLAPVTTPDPRTLKPNALAPPQQPPAKPAPYEAPPGSASPAFQAVPASVVSAPQRIATPTIGIRPEPAEITGPVVPGGSGWNIRSRDGNTGRGKAEVVEDLPTWRTRKHPKANRDRSAWTVPAAPRARRVSSRTALGVGLSIVLLAILAFAGYEWATGRPQPSHTITTPPAVGTLTAIDTPATDAVTQQMEKVMLQYGATRVVSGVYGTAGRATLIVLLAQGSGIETSSKQFFNDFASGLKAQGVSIISGEMVNTAANGSYFVCSPATGPAPLTAVSLCGWDDGDTIGLVMDVSGEPVSATLRQAEAARGAGEH